MVVNGALSAINMSTSNWYDVLEVAETASKDEMKAKYQELLLRLHPDKVKEEDEDASKSVEDVIKAWKILSDADSRRKFDADLKLRREKAEDANFFRIITFKEWQHDKEDLSLCRCGGEFDFEEDDASEDVVIVDCDTCSLAIKVTPY